MDAVETHICFKCHKEINAENPGTDGRTRYELEALHPGVFTDDMKVCMNCARKHLLQMYREKYMKILVPLFHEINDTLHDNQGLQSQGMADAFCSEHRQLQGDLIEFLAKVVKILGNRADDPKWTDARNVYQFRYLKELAHVNA